MPQRTSLLIINSHPIQYFAPLYRRLGSDPAFDLTVLYCSRHGLSGELDQQFGTSVQWDIPLLEGYNFEFLSNASYKPSIHSFWGLVNLSVVKKLWKARKSVIIVNGWATATCYIAILFAWLFGHKVCMRADSSNLAEQLRAKWKLNFRQGWLGYGLFSFIDYFLYIGEQNKSFYKFYRVPDAKLLYCPFAVDNDRFRSQSEQLSQHKAELKRRLSFPNDHKVIVFSGKYLPNKRPLDLLKAICKLDRDDVSALLLGEGESRQELTDFIKENQLLNATLTGFINQSKIGEYYAVADVYVMCSTLETWGLSTNEAMNFGVPLVLSDTIGCAQDLVTENVNGYTYPCGDVAALADRLSRLLTMPSDQREAMGRASMERINQYSYEQTVDTLKAAFYYPE